MMNRLDVIIFGASGYSGKYVVQNLVKVSTNEKCKITWGIAGRSLEKLQSVIKEMELKLGRKFDEVPMMVANTDDENSLIYMALRARLVVNCTGPYKIHGEAVVRACIQQNCHYIDICAEPQFMERMQLLYNEEAANKGVYVVPSCGVDSIPSDMGVDFVRKSFKGTLNSVEVYQEVLSDKWFGAGPCINSGTWESLVYVLADYSELRKIREKLFQIEVPPLVPKLSYRCLLPRIPLSRNHAGPYPGCEATVIRRSQRYFYETNNSRPIQIRSYVGFFSFLVYILLFFGFWIWVLMSKLRFTRNLLLKYPRFFTGGFFGTSPLEENTKMMELVATFYGQGWKGKSVDVTYQQKEDSWIVGKVRGRDGYHLTGLCAAVSALVLVGGSQKLPQKGGVYTTAPVFTDTELVEMLQRYGLEFEVCDRGDM
ncbi:saccharopine dehydrogenase-like oxidoreductase [Tenebrio molitor]|uniref:saccharopine dehydrogenase-like oxidoreductase n=1 Tax=Tenebrio molitor TaxID=7067 RepID=UPI003624A6E3